MIDKPQRPGAEFATDRYGGPFFALIAVFALASFAEQSQLIRVTLAVLVVAIVLMNLRATGSTRRRMRIAQSVAGALALAIVAGAPSDRPEVAAAFGIGGGVVLALGAVALIRRIFEHELVTFRLVVAALTAYLQVAVVFAFVYGGLANVSSGTFFAQGDAVASKVMYFSVVTMTTLGYGDVTPATNIGQALAMIQTLFGQIFLVVLVAYLVGSLGRQRPRFQPE